MAPPTPSIHTLPRYPLPVALLTLPTEASAHSQMYYLCLLFIPFSMQIQCNKLFCFFVFFPMMASPHIKYFSKVSRHLYRSLEAVEVGISQSPLNNASSQRGIPNSLNIRGVCSCFEGVKSEYYTFLGSQRKLTSCHECFKELQTYFIFFYN